MFKMLVMNFGSISMCSQLLSATDPLQHEAFPTTSTKLPLMSIQNRNQSIEVKQKNKYTILTPMSGICPMFLFPFLSLIFTGLCIIMVYSLITYP